MIFNTKELQEVCKEEIRQEVATLGRVPNFKIIQVGDNPASNKYIGQKIKHCEDVGINVQLIKLHHDVITLGVINVINREQQDADAIIVQLPLPPHIDERKVLEAIDPMKDVDCLTTKNIGLLHAGIPYVEPCTPSGIIEILNLWCKSLEGKSALIVGRSHIVGRPLAEMLTARDMTVTLAHSKTENLKHMLRGHKFDVIISAVGKPKVFTAAADILIDVGINFDEENKMCGDFNLDTCSYRLATPVTNGVGRMTIIGLLRNIVKVTKR